MIIYTTTFIVAVFLTFIISFWVQDKIDSKVNKGATEDKEILGSGLTIEEKIMAVSLSPEMAAAIKILVAVFEDCDLKTHIRYTYEVNGEYYELTFLKTNKPREKI